MSMMLTKEEVVEAREAQERAMHRGGKGDST